MKFLSYRKIIIVSILSLPFFARSINRSVLFIGNSHTYTNNMPILFANLAQTGGHLVNVDQSTVGSSTLSYHSHYQPTLDLITDNEWGFVVLQEHSLLSVIEYWRDNSFYPKATWLDSLIISTGSETVLFMHQARENASGLYCI